MVAILWKIIHLLSRAFGSIYDTHRRQHTISLRFGAKRSQFRLNLLISNLSDVSSAHTFCSLN